MTKRNVICRCVAINGDDTKFQEIVNELLQSKDYPKIEEYHKRQKRLEIKKKFIEGMSVEEFLEYFEDPEKVKFIPAHWTFCTAFSEAICLPPWLDL